MARPPSSVRANTITWMKRWLAIVALHAQKRPYCAAIRIPVRELQQMYSLMRGLVSIFLSSGMDCAVVLSVCAVAVGKSISLLEKSCDQLLRWFTKVWGCYPTLP